MNKKLLLTLFSLFSVVLLVISYNAYQKKIETQGDQALLAYESTLSEKQKEKEGLIASLNPESNPDQNLLDYLHFKALEKEKVTISLLGSSVTAGAGSSNPQAVWGNRLVKNIKATSSNFKNINLYNNGFGGYSTVGLLKDDKLEEVIKNNPDLVIFETSILNNHGQSVSLEQTLEDIKTIVSTIERDIPNAEILLVSPNPATGKEGTDAVNEIGLTYEDYVTETTRFINQNGWKYFNTYEEINSRITEEDIELSSLMFDEIHPNDEGYRIWAEELFSFISE